MTTTTKKYITILDNCNYDYPTCGGQVVKQNKTHTIIEFYSNFIGGWTGKIIRLENRRNFCAEDYIDYIVYLNEDDTRRPADFKILKRGYLVS